MKKLYEYFAKNQGAYIEGEAFVGTNGDLFVLDGNVLRITNVSDGIRIEW